jgi:hypothetical protein
MEPMRDEEAAAATEAEPAPEPPPGPGLPPPTALESLVSALLESGPEVAEHVVRAAQELLLAAQAVIDAAERAVEEQRDLQSAGAPGPANAAASVHPLERHE